MDERCIVCANGNDLPDGECCRACGRQAGPASHDDELDALRQHLCRHSIREHYASATLRIAELEAELARVREDLKAWERNCASLIAHRDEALEKVERVARRAAHLSKYHLELSIADCAAQAMREEG